MMELVVAIAMAAMVLLAIGMSSRWIVGHVISRRQAARLDAETQRIADAVVGQLRRAREIRQWDRTSIEFVSGVTGDTVVYRFAGDRLVRNGTVMRPRVPDGEISGFRLSRDSPEVLVETPEILLRISLSCADRRGNTSNVTASATVAAPPEGVEPATDGWNF
jgi:hypothetical protein